MARVVASALFATGSAAAQNLVHIDATAPVPPPKPVLAKLGSARNPRGEVIGVNSQYLTLNGAPWLPVMGEFHYSRTPAEDWEPEILKMKAAGVQIISTYVIWIHQEQVEGVYDWSGQRDLRRFVQLCGKHGMYVYPRIGPWVHAEVRNGGLPDWVLKNGPVRQNDLVYLREVDSFDRQIDTQLAGLLWKEGGPVIGLQIDNEYRDRGPGRGDDHMRALKRMAVDAGLDVPLYTATAWDNAAAPLDAVLPVFGGYPDAPWDGSPKQLPPAELYAFRFGNRAAGNMGAIGGNGQGPAFFFALPSVPAEMLFAKGTRVEASSGGVTPEETSSGLRVRIAAEKAADFRLGGGAHVVVLPEAQAEDVWQTDDRALLLLTHQTAFFDGPRWTLESESSPRFEFGLFGTDQRPSAAGASIKPQPADGLFHQYAATLPEVKLQAKWTSTAPAGPRPPWTMGPAFSWRPEPIAMAPDDPEFEKAAAWQIQLPATQEHSGLSNIFLRIGYRGDVARVYRGSQLLEDNFWNGQPWTLSLRQLGILPSATPEMLNLRILPLPQTNPFYLEQVGQLPFNDAGLVSALDHVEIVPQYQLHLCLVSGLPLPAGSQPDSCNR